MTNHRRKEASDAIHAWIQDIHSEVDVTQMQTRFWGFTEKDQWEDRCALVPNSFVPCLMWTGGVDMAGYPIFTIKGIRVYAHRIAVRLGLYDPYSEDRIGGGWRIPPRAIPKGMTVDHDKDKGCSRDYRCVYPEHLTVVSRGANSEKKRDLSVFT